jgi:hypothetical protein
MKTGSQKCINIRAKYLQKKYICESRSYFRAGKDGYVSKVEVGRSLSLEY